MNQKTHSHNKTMMQIIDDSSMGGAENHTRLITKEFARRGYKILLLCPHGPYVERFNELSEIAGSEVEILATPHISKHYMNPLLGFDMIHLVKAVKLIRRLIVSKNIQIIHSHKHPMDLLVALSTINFPHTIKISTVHSMDNKDKFWVWKWWRYYFIKNSLLKFDRVFTVSENVRANTLRFFSLAPQKVVTMMNGIDLSELRPDISAHEARQKYEVQPDQFVILSIGKVEYRKGQDILLLAVSSLIKSRNLAHKISVLIAGDSNLQFKRKLLSLSKELGIEENVKWIGYENNVSNLLQITDVYVQPSRWDPLPRALIEAMGMGIFSIGSNVDGIPELIEHEKTGLLFENENADDLALQIKKALMYPELGKACTEAAINKIKNHHTISCMVDTIEKSLYGVQVEDRP